MAQSRVEAILENILGAQNEVLDPVSRNEILLIQIADQLEGTPNEPITSNDIDEIVNSIE